MNSKEIAAEIFDRDLNIHNMPAYIAKLLEDVEYDSHDEGEAYAYENLDINNPAVVYANIAYALEVLKRLETENVNNVIRELTNELCTFQKPLGYDPPKQKGIWDDEQRTFIDNTTNKKLVLPKKPLR